MKKLLILLLTPFIFVGCAISKAELVNVSDAELCYKRLDKRYEFLKENLYKEIASRGVKCQKHSAYVAKKLNEDRLREEEFRRWYAEEQKLKEQREHELKLAYARGTLPPRAPDYSCRANGNRLLCTPQ